jgi:hypothetical protein
MFRRRLLKRTAIFLAGSLAFPYVSQIYPPLDLDLMLVFFGVLFFVALAIAVILERRARNHLELEVLKRVFAGFIPLPWILAAVLFLNGKLDSQKNVTYHPTVVVSRYNMPGIVRGGCSFVPGVKGRESNAWRWTSMTTIAFAGAIRCLWAWRQARSASRGFTACIAAEEIFNR